MKLLFSHIEKFTPLSIKAKDTLEGIISIHTYKHGDVLCHIGSKPTKVYFIIQGIVRGYAAAKNGNTYNRALYIRGEFMASLSSLINKTQATLALECLTDCEIVEADYQSFINLGKKIPELALIYIKVLEENFIKLEQSNIQLATLNATERYLTLRKRIPGIDNAISQFHIASHLGITPIQLSRIRKIMWSIKN